MAKKIKNQIDLIIKDYENGRDSLEMIEKQYKELQELLYKMRWWELISEAVAKECEEELQRLLRFLIVKKMGK